MTTEWDHLRIAAHVWHLCPDDLPPDALERRCLTWLTPGELAHHQRLRTPAFRHVHLVSRALCRTMLSHHTNVDPTAWRFATNEHGKPSISAPAEFASLHFNLTHTDGLIACAISRAGPVGVDAEQTSRAVDIDRVAAHFFSPAERASLSQLPPNERNQRFFEYWVAKEAYLKASGVGLSLPPDTFTIELNSEHQPLPIDDFQLALHRPGPRHIAAVAVHRAPDDPPVEILWREAAPLL